MRAYVLELDDFMMTVTGIDPYQDELESRCYELAKNHFDDPPSTVNLYIRDALPHDRHHKLASFLVCNDDYVVCAPHCNQDFDFDDCIYTLKNARICLTRR